MGVGAGSAKRTLRGAKVSSARAWAVPEQTFSSGYDKFSPTVTGRPPSPTSTNLRQMLCGVRMPPVRKKTGRPCSTSATGSSSTPWAEHSRQSCQGRPSRAAKSWTLERHGKTRAGIPACSSRGSRPLAPE